LADLKPKRLSYDSEMMVWSSYGKLAEEHITERGIKVLSGVNESVFAAGVEFLDDTAQPDDLRPSSENRNDFH